ncbi:MAG: polysaccharide biosynthesis tyrosine autokinase [Prolixibacteraceae bacterium]|nr:polysaccharide biosynthesis tyrosine autokinase [Prolixibacteraceae bacterium]
MDKIEDLLNSFESEDKEIRQNVILKYTKKWYWFAIFCTLGIIAGFVVYKLTPPTYQVQSRLLIPTEDNALSALLPFDSPVMPKGQKIENQIGILQSFTLYKKALENLNWKTTFYLDQGYYLFELYENPPFEITIPSGAYNTSGFMLKIVALNDFEFEVNGEGKIFQDGKNQSVSFKERGKFNSPFKNAYFDFTLNKKNYLPGETYVLLFNDFNQLTQEYLRSVSINLEDKKSELINVQLVGPNPKKSADFINELNQVFISFGMKKKNQTSENSISFIDTTLVGISNSLKNAELNLSNYRKDNKVLDMGTEATVIYQKLEEIENEKYLAKMRIDYYRNLQSYMGDAKKIKQMVNPSIVGVTDAGLTSLLPKLTDLYSKREVLTYSVEANNPSLILLEKEIQLTSNALLENLNNLLKNAEIEMQGMENRFAAVQARLEKLPDTERKLVSIQRDFTLNNELYTYMLQKKAEASISLASNIPQVQIIDDAMVEAAEQVGPNLMMNVIAGLGLGFVIPFIFILLADLFNTKLETIEEVSKLTKLPTLDGIIHSNYKNSLPVFNNPQSGIAESFRVLKVNLRNALNNPDKKVISVNSLVSGEGKSFISSNLASILSMGANEKKVLLIEGDLRKPMLNGLFGKNGGIGLSSYLSHDNNFNEIVIETPYPNLFFIPAGDMPSNPTELLENGRFANFIEEARKRFDYVILDNAPVSLVPDGLMTSKHADANIFILRLNYSRKKEVREINKTIDVNGIKNAIIVINDAPNNRFGYGNKYWKNGYGNYVKVAKPA